MKILLTGAQGFLGGRVLDFLLDEGHRVRVLTRRPAPEMEARGIEVFKADLGEADQVEKAADGIGGIVHCAARSGIWGELHDFIAANTLTTLNLLRAARLAGVKWFVYTSSPSVVHTGRPLDGADETAPYTTNPNQAYPYSKMLAEKMVLAADEAGFRTTALRPHLIWGPGDPHFLPRLKCKALSGRLWLLKSEALVDGTYIDNAAWAHIQAVKKMMSGQAAQIAGKAYFIAQGEPLPAAELIAKLLEAISEPERPLKIKGLLPAGLGVKGGAIIETLWRFLKLKKEPPLTRFVAEELTLPHWFNLDRARRELGYSPIVTMKDGLERLKPGAAGQPRPACPAST